MQSRGHQDVKLKQLFCYSNSVLVHTISLDINKIAQTSAVRFAKIRRLMMAENNASMQYGFSQDILLMCTPISMFLFAMIELMFNLLLAFINLNLLVSNNHLLAIQANCDTSRGLKTFSLPQMYAKQHEIFLRSDLLSQI